MKEEFYRHFFDLGIISSRLFASKSKEDKEREYKELKRILNSLEIQVPDFNEDHFEIINYSDYFSIPNLKLKKSLYSLGTLSFALFLLGELKHIEAENEFIALFDVIGLNKKIALNYIDDLQLKGKVEAFKTFITIIYPEIEEINEKSLSKYNTTYQDDSFILSEFNLLREQLKESFDKEYYFSDIDSDLNEISICLSNQCYRATLALTGRVLELSLKLYCKNNSIPFEDNWMVGKLLTVVSSSGLYIDPSINNIWNVINQQRIIGVHSRTLVPVPSRSQAHMVCHALLDSLRRIFHIKNL